MNPIHVSATVSKLKGWCLDYVLHRHRDTARRVYEPFSDLAILSFELIHDSTQDAK